jgi:hypothetical protein
MHALDLGINGTLGSDIQIPKTPDKKAQKIAALLGYSSDTRIHLRTLMNILSAPAEFSLRKPQGQQVDAEYAETGDVLHRLIEGYHYFQFTKGVDDPYLQGLQSGINPYTMSSAQLDVSIYQRSGGLWAVSYFYALPRNRHSTEEEKNEVYYQDTKHNINEDLVSPERKFLLSFIFSPQKLNGLEVCRTKISDFYMQFIQNLGPTKIGKFNAQNYLFDAGRLVNFYRNSNSPKDFEPEIYCLEKDGNRQFQIVDVGREEIGNMTYHIYTGSEQALTQDRVASPSGSLSAAPHTTPSYVTAPASK